MKRSTIKKIKIFGSLGGIIAIGLASTYSIFSTNINYPNIQNNLNPNLTMNENNLNISPIHNKAAANQDFILNSNNAISLTSTIQTTTSLSTTNGPRGFLTQTNGFVSYIGYDGKEIWKSIQMLNNYSLVSSYYNETAKCFVVLYSTSLTDLRVSSISELNGNIISSAVNYAAFGAIGRHLLIPVYNDDKSVSQYIIVSQTKQLLLDRIMTIFNIDNNGNLTSPTNYRLNDKSLLGSTHGILAAGAVNYGGNRYLFLLSQFLIGGVYLQIYKETASNFVITNNSVLIDGTWPISLDDSYIDRNIPEIWLLPKSSPTLGLTISVTGFLNADKDRTKIFGGSYRISNDSLSNVTINLQQQNLIDYDIYKGRFYGNYFYGYLDYANYGQAEDKTLDKIIRLQADSTIGNDWTINGLKWNNDYNNTRIILYDSRYQLDIASGSYNAIALPFYTTDYSTRPNVLTTTSRNNDTNLYLLDGTKAAYAYQTKSKSVNNVFAISGVSDIYAQDANNDLKAYFTNDIFTDNFSQYQIGTSYTIDKKTDSSDLIKNYQGIIPAILTVVNGYNNTDFNSTDVSFDIELTGFKTSATIINENPNTTLPDDLKNSLASSITNNSSLKQYIFSNCVIDPTKTLQVNSISNINIVSYNNLIGQLKLNVQFNKFFNINGIEVNDYTYPNLITISGFKLAKETTLLKTTIAGDNSLLASIQTATTLSKIIYDKRHELFDILAIPEGFSQNDINVNIISNSVNDKTGSLQVTLTLNKYYDNQGILVTTTSSDFPTITINGFATTNYVTTINSNPATSSILNNILAQNIDSSISNINFKDYLFTNVIDGTKTQMSSSNISSIGIKSYDNLNGVLVLSSITLNKYWDVDTSLLVSNSKTFTQDISITGFKIVEETDVNRTINGNLNSSQASAVTIAQLTNMLFVEKENIFITNSIPDGFNQSNIFNLTIVANSVNDKTGSLEINFDINKYYNNLGILVDGTKSLGPITINGFATTNYVTTINANPIQSSILNNVLAQDFEILSDPLEVSGLKQYLFDNVIQGEKLGMSVNDIKAIAIKADSFDNIKGSITLDSITLGKWYNPDTSLLENTNKIFTGPINISGFKTVVPTKINESFNSELVDISASKITIDELKQLLFNKLSDIFVLNSLPDDFRVENIDSVSILENSINDKNGSLQVNFIINKYYDTNGKLISNTNLSLGPIIIGGFISNNFETTIDTTPNPANLVNFLAQEIYESFDPLSTVGLKQYLFDKVIQGEKLGMSVNDIKAIAIKADSFDNIKGSITLDSITLGKWYNPDTSLLETTNKIFTGPINISGFKQIQATNLRHTTFNFSDDLNNILPSEMTSQQLSSIIYNHRNEIFSDNSLPISFVENNITNIIIDAITVDDASGTLQFVFSLNNYYNNDNGALTAFPIIEFGPITLGGFNKNGLGTSIKPTNNLISLNTLFPYEITNLIDNITIKQFIFDNIIDDQNKNVLSIDNIIEIKLSSLAYNNKEGVLFLDSITLNKWHENNGTLTNGRKIFNLGNTAKIEIAGFKKVSGYTDKSISKVNVSGSLTSLTTEEISDEELLIWVRENLDLLFTNLVNVPSSTNVVSITKTSSSVFNGELKLDVVLNQYYDNDQNYSYKNSEFLFKDIILKGFLSKNLETSIHASGVDVSGDLTNILPQQLDENKDNDDFKKYLLTNIIVDPTGNLNINNIVDFSGTYNNINGEYTLNSITLNQTYNKDGQLNAGHTFAPLSHTIKGFDKSKATSAILDVSIDSKQPNVLASDVLSADFLQIIINNYTQVITNLPDGFTANNIVDVLKNKADNDLGYLYLSVSINTYYDASGKLITNGTPLLLENIIISGFKKTNVFPEINLTERVNINLYNQSYSNQFAGNIINNSDVTIATTWLQSDSIFPVVVNNSMGLSRNNFSVGRIRKIDNLKGEISVVINISNGTTLPNKNIITFYGFKTAISIDEWKNNINNAIEGELTNPDDIKNDIIRQIINLSNSINSPFINPLNENNIEVTYIPGDNSYAIVIKNTQYVDNNGDISDKPINANVKYGPKTSIDNKTNNNDNWIWILIYSLVGTVAFAILLLIIIILIKHHRNRK